MNGKFALLITLAMFGGSAYAATQAVVAFSFVCSGTSTGPCPNGAVPNSLIQASDGNFYGTTANSGTNANGQTIMGGTVFSLAPAGKFTLLHRFTPGTTNKFANGATPTSLTEGPDGKLYGLTLQGGNNVSAVFQGYGVLFRINNDGSGFQVIHRFCSNAPYCGDGGYNEGALIVGGDGNIYGVTNGGGHGSGCGSGGCGTIFRAIPSSGAYDVAFNLSFSDAGGFPSITAAAPDGTFYGLTINGDGLFHYTPTTGSFQSTTLAFPTPPGCPGFACTAANVLAVGPSGNLFGFYAVYGVIGAAGPFEVQPDGSNLQLFSKFTAFSGTGPQLLLASDGNFWFPVNGGSSKDGNLVAIPPSDGKVVRTLAPFSSKVFGPTAIIQAKDGTLWGVASGGVVTGTGHFAGGAVFSLNAGLPPR